MNHDLVVFLSGWIPFGIYLPRLVGFFLSIIWLVVWAGTRFWEKRVLRRNLIRIWALIFILYFTAWFIDPPPAIPIRVTLFEHPDSTSWQACGVSELLRNGLSRSNQPIVLLDRKTCPGLEPTSDRREYERLASIAPTEANVD